MAEERNTESFALGVIVAAIVFLLLRRELGKHVTETETEAAQPAVSTCGCGASAVQETAQNPGVSIGGQSYSAAPFKQSSITPAKQSSVTPSKQWYAGQGPSGGAGAEWGA